MHFNGLIAFTGLVALAAAVPMHEHHRQKREYVWVTETEEAVVTIPVTETVWIDAGETAPTSTAAAVVDHQQQPAFTSPAQHAVPTPSSSGASPEYVAPAPSTSTSVYIAPTPQAPPAYVAPTTTSTPVYVAPTTEAPPAYVAPTSEAPAPYVAPSSSAPAPYVAPAPSPSAAAPSPASSAPAANSYSSGGGSGLSYGMGESGTTYSGDFTNYELGLGACGDTNGADDAVVAISHVIFDSYPNGNPNLNPVCRKTITITGADGNSYVAKVVDRCPGCAEADLDMGLPFFNKVTNSADGRAHNMKWAWN